jgi:hypothetical protein
VPCSDWGYNCRFVVYKIIQVLNMMPWKMFVSLCALCALSGCATIVAGRYTHVNVSTGYDDAKVTYVDRFGNAEYVGTGRVVAITFMRKDIEKNLIKVSKDSCLVNSTTVVGEFEPVALLNVLTLGVGFLLDWPNGTLSRPASKEIHLQPICNK